MIIVTMNVRGVGGNSKFLALKRFIESEKPDVLLIQETMVCVEKAKEMFVKLLPSWNFCGVDFVGFSGGLLITWNSVKADCNAFLTPAGILLEVL